MLSIMNYKKNKIESEQVVQMMIHQKKQEKDIRILIATQGLKV